MPLYLLLATSRPARRPAPEPVAPGLPTGGTTPPAAGAEGPAVGGDAALRTGADRVLFARRDAELEPPAGFFR